MKNVTIIDYDVGNILSVSRAFEKQGANIELTSDIDKILKAEHLVLPGVGAFGKAMDELKKRNLIEPLQEFSKTGRPFLGICLGMQLLATKSYEFGTHEGLNLIPGEIKKISEVDSEGKPHKIPHISWAPIRPQNIDWKGSVLEGIEPESTFYFVHSYAFHPDNQENYLAKTNYNGIEIAACVKKDNVFGCQFHPEKSGPLGLKVLENFLNLN